MISGFKIEYQVGNVPAGEDTLQRMALAFERFGDELVDFEQHVFPRVIPVLEAAAERQFDAQGRGPNKGAWSPLSPAYEEAKQALYPGAPILVRTGTLREALTSSTSPFARRVMGKDEFDFGTLGVEYASFHQEGTASMPDRPPFDFDSEFERELSVAAREGVRAAHKASRADEFSTEGPG